MTATPNVERVALRVPEAAFSAGVSIAFLYDAMNAGALKSVKLGKRRLIRTADLDAWVSAGEVKGR